MAVIERPEGEEFPPITFEGATDPPPEFPPVTFEGAAPPPTPGVLPVPPPLTEPREVLDLETGSTVTAPAGSTPVDIRRQIQMEIRHVPEEDLFGGSSITTLTDVLKAIDIKAQKLGNLRPTEEPFRDFFTGLLVDMATGLPRAEAALLTQTGERLETPRRNFATELAVLIGEGLREFRETGMAVVPVEEIQEIVREGSAQFIRETFFSPSVDKGLIADFLGKNTGLPDLFKNSGAELKRMILLDMQSVGVLEDFETPSFGFLVGSGISTSAQALGMTLVTRNPRIAAIYFGILQDSRAYESAREANFDPDKAAAVAQLQGLSEGVLEAMGQGRILGVLTGKGGPLSRIVLGTGIEILTEVSQTAAETGISVAAGVEEVTLEELSKRMQLSGLVTIFSAGATTTIVVGGQEISNRNRARQIAARLKENITPEAMEAEMPEAVEFLAQDAAFALDHPGKQQQKINQMFKAMNDGVAIDKVFQTEEQQKQAVDAAIKTVEKGRKVIERAEKRVKAGAKKADVRRISELDREIARLGDKFTRAFEEDDSPAMARIETAIEKARRAKEDILDDEVNGADDFKEIVVQARNVRALASEAARNAISTAKSAFAAGERSARNETKEVQKALKQLFKRPGVETRKFLDALVNIQTFEQLEARLPQLVLRVEREMLRTQRRQQVAALEKTIKKTKPTKRKSKIDPDTQEHVFTPLRALLQESGETVPDYQARLELAIAKIHKTVEEGVEPDQLGGLGLQLEAANLFLERNDASPLEVAILGDTLAALAEGGKNALAEERAEERARVDEMQRSIIAANSRAEKKIAALNVEVAARERVAEETPGKRSAKALSKAKEARDRAVAAKGTAINEVGFRKRRKIHAATSTLIYTTGDNTVLLDDVLGLPPKHFSRALRDAEIQHTTQITRWGEEISAAYKEAFGFKNEGAMRKHLQKDLAEEISSEILYVPRGNVEELVEDLEAQIEAVHVAESRRAAEKKEIEKRKEERARRAAAAPEDAIPRIEIDLGPLEGVPRVEPGKQAQKKIKSLEKEIKHWRASAKTAFPQRMSMTKGQMRARVMQLQDPELRDFIRSPDGMGYTDEMVGWIVSKLTDQDAAFIEAQFGFYRNRYSAVNEVYRQVFGIDLGRRDFYSPISREFVEGDKPPITMDEFGTRRELIGFNSIETRNPNATSQLADINDFETVSRYIYQASLWTSYIIPSTRIENAFRRPGVKKTVREAHGDFILTAVNRSLQINKEREGVDGWLTTMLTVASNFGTRTLLPYKVVIGMKQVPSMLVFDLIEGVDSVNFAKNVALFPSQMTEAVATLNQSIDYEVRWKNYNLAISDMEQSREYQAWLNNPTFENAMFFFIRFGDATAVYVGGWGAYKTLVDKGIPPEIALRRVADHMVRTQQSTQPSSLAPVFQGPVSRHLVKFQSGPLALARLEVSIIIKLFKGKATTKQVAKTLFIIHTLVSPLIQAVADIGFVPENQLRAVLMGPLNSVLIIGDIVASMVSTVLGADVWEKDLFAFDVMSRLLREFNELLDGDDVTWEDVVSVLAAIVELSSAAVGKAATKTLPAGQALNVFEGLRRIGEDDIVEGTEFLLGWSASTIEKAEKRREGEESELRF